MKHFKNTDSYITLVWVIIFAAMCITSLVVLFRYGFVTHWFCALIAGVTGALAISYTDDIQKLERGE